MTSFREENIENKILFEMAEFIKKNNENTSKLSDTEIFEIIDFDNDGLINSKDLTNFVEKYLHISQANFNEYQIKTIMKSISLSKNYQVGINDIREFINKVNSNSFNFQIKRNLNNKKYINHDILDKFNLFISEKYLNLKDFFNEYSIDKKINYDRFLKFYNDNYEEFISDLHIIKEEIPEIFNYLDNNKKGYLIYSDLEENLNFFNFYEKLHFDIKKFLKQNFNNSLDAFKFFKKFNNNLNEENKNNNNYNIFNNKSNEYKITIKEFFDTLENFFPKKYSTNILMKYIQKIFGISTATNKITTLHNKKDTIDFSEFNYYYFDQIKENEYYLNNKNKLSKLKTNRQRHFKMPENVDKNSNYYFSNLFKKNFESLSTPFDNDPLNKVRRIVCTSRFDINRFFEDAAILNEGFKKDPSGYIKYLDDSNEFELTNVSILGNNLLYKKDPNLIKVNKNYIVNKFVFRMLLKNLNIGLTNLEISQIINNSKITFNENVDLRNFIKYLYNTDVNLEIAQNHSYPILEEIKSLIYKYYSNPILCFENNDTFHNHIIDFEKFKLLINEMYKNDEKNLPNFNQLKIAFDNIDLRKDGIIDLNEWMRAFSSFNGKNDVNKQNCKNNFEFYDNNFKIKYNFDNNSWVNKNRKILRDWETSKDVIDLYLFINKNKKLIKDKINQNNFIIENGNIRAKNLLKILKDLLPKLKLSSVQWGMIVNVANSYDDFIDLDKWFKLMSITAKNFYAIPKGKEKNDLLNKYHCDLYGSMNGFYDKKTKRNFYFDKDQFLKSFNQNQFNLSKTNVYNLTHTKFRSSKNLSMMKA